MVAEMGQLQKSMSTARGRGRGWGPDTPPVRNGYNRCCSRRSIQEEAICVVITEKVKR
jgi:hypothetical protein